MGTPRRASSKSSKPTSVSVEQSALDELCRRAGLDAIGVTSPDAPEHADFFSQWLDRGLHGEMYFMQQHAELRREPRRLLKGAKSIICFAWNYNPPPTTTADATTAKPAAHGKVARYARGADYHPLFKRRMHRFWDLFAAAYPARARSRFFTDSGPLMERDLAARARLGWIGKNSCLIHPKLGSWLFLGEIVTTLEIQVIRPTAPITQHCGTCTACLDACPTGALTAPYTLDSNRCIAYLTIEKRGDFAADQAPLIRDHLFGCDICQEVCPWNRRAPEGNFLRASPHPLPAANELNTLQVDDAEAFTQRFGPTPIVRTGFDGWQRNLKTVRKNLKRSGA